MKIKILLLFLLLGFLTCYLEWGTGQHEYIFQAEFSVFNAAQKSAQNVIHPLILIPFLGQLIILICLFIKEPKKWLVYTGLILMGILVLVLLLVGILARNAHIILSTLPFLIASVLIFIHYKKPKTSSELNV